MICLECCGSLTGDVVELPCSHKYHKTCLLMWCQEHSDCPLCRTTIHWAKPVILSAAFRGDLEGVRCALEHGAEVDACSPLGSTPLILAAMTGHTRVVQALLVAGADVDASTNDGRTALWVAGFGGHRDVAQMLLSYGASPQTYVEGFEAASFPVIRAVLQARHL